MQPDIGLYASVHVHFCMCATLTNVLNQSYTEDAELWKQMKKISTVHEEDGGETNEETKKINF